MRQQPDIVVPALLQYLNSVQVTSDWEVRDVIASLARFGTNAKAAVPLLIKLLDHPDPSVRTEVTNQLPKADPGLFGGRRISEEYVLRNSIDFLKAASDYPDFDLAAAVVVIGRLGTNAQSAAPLLIKLLGHPDAELRVAITNWLPRIDADAAVKAGIVRSSANR